MQSCQFRGCYLEQKYSSLQLLCDDTVTTAIIPKSKIQNTDNTEGAENEGNSNKKELELSEKEKAGVDTFKT